MTVHEESNYRISFDEKVPCVIWEPLGYLTVQQFKSSLDLTKDLFDEMKKKYPTTQWLNDTRKMKVVGKEEQDWLNKDLNVRVFKDGLKFIAFVLPESVFGSIALKLYINLTLSRGDYDLKIKSFNDGRVAREWLRTNASVVLENA